MVSQLHRFCHHIWIRRNDIVHERDEFGLKITEAAELDAEIERQFELGTDTLASQDFALLRSHSKAAVLRFSAVDKRMWVHCIVRARNLFLANPDAEEAQQQQALRDWLRGNS